MHELTEQQTHRGDAADVISVLRKELERRERELQTLLQDLGGVLAPAAAGKVATSFAHLLRVWRLRDAVRDRVPADRVVLVIGQEDGDSRFQPATSAEAIAQLEELRASGTEYLAFPEPADGWIARNVAFRGHVERTYRLAYRSEDTCALFSLTEASAWRDIGELVAGFKVRHRRYPAILDWQTGVELARIFPECAVFVPMEPDRDEVPYLDQSIDIVAVGAGVPGRVAEARRVATEAVLIVTPPGGDRRDPDLTIERHRES